MITCNRHGRRHYEALCDLQERATAAMLHAQRQGDAVALVLFDGDDKYHRVLATIGLTRETREALALALIEAPTFPMEREP